MRSTLVIGLFPTDIIIEFSDLEKTILLGSIDKNVIKKNTNNFFIIYQLMETLLHQKGTRLL